MIRVRFHRAAGAEAEAAVRWYNERVPGLGDDFRTELIAAVEWIVEGPEVWPISVDDPRSALLAVAISVLDRLRRGG